MADKKHKTQAEKTASAAKANSKNKNNNQKDKKTAAGKQTEAENKLPVRFISSIVFLAMGVLFAIMLFTSEGALLTLIENVICGIIGRTAFVVSVPVLLYLFLIHAFSGKRPIKLRTA